MGRTSGVIEVVNLASDTAEAKHLRRLVSDLNLPPAVVEGFVRSAIEAKKQTGEELADLDEQINLVFPDDVRYLEVV